MFTRILSNDLPRSRWLALILAALAVEMVAKSARRKTLIDDPEAEKKGGKPMVR